MASGIKAVIFIFHRSVRFTHRKDYVQYRGYKIPKKFAQIATPTTLRLEGPFSVTIDGDIIVHHNHQVLLKIPKKLVFALHMFFE